ncbi:MBOAT family protein, partial [Candidatus Calescamantes bacterium]|nr:MBOAT family protein [Candidatus Calescamantes bacterium]
WHISLSTWLRDYLYISLGGNRKGRIITCRNLMITMLLGGLWHGAGWNFIIWGFYWGMLLIIHRLFLYLNEIKGKILFPRIPKFIGVLITFHLICYGYLMFRSNSLDQIIFLSSSLFSNFHLTSLSIYWMSQIFIFSWLLILVEIIQYKRGNLDLILHISPWWQGLFYLTLSFMILLFGVTGGKEFVYFQF